MNGAYLCIVLIHCCNLFEQLFEHKPINFIVFSFDTSIINILMKYLLSYWIFDMYTDRPDNMISKKRSTSLPRKLYS